MSESGMSESGMSESGMSESEISESGMSESGMSESGMSESGMGESGMSVSGMRDSGDERVRDARVTDEPVRACCVGMFPLACECRPYCSWSLRQKSVPCRRSFLFFAISLPEKRTPTAPSPPMSVVWDKNPLRLSSRRHTRRRKTPSVCKTSTRRTRRW